MYILGIDGGGTKTVCVVMDQTGKVLAQAQAGPSNYQSIGIKATQQSIETAIKEAVIATNLSIPLAIQGMGIGLAGVGRPQDINSVENLLKPLPLKLSELITWQNSPQHLLITGDNEIALMGGIGDRIGIVAIAGTGSQVFGQNQQGKTKRVGGWGYILGDEGSGYNISVKGLQAALKAYDGRGQATELIERFKDHLEIDKIENLVEVVYRRRLSVTEIAALAPIVDQAAVEGDAIAREIMTSAVNELTLATQVVITDLFNPTEAFEIVTIGGVWNSLANLRQRFEQKISAIAPSATVIWPRHQPAYGAGLLALQEIMSLS
ncbi:MAG: BadF/BadG/BcrA/BcrD ATPase family protein [Microcoleaceae cyanobacterium]